MMLVSPFQGTVDRAIGFMGDAQGVAADAANDPNSTSSAKLEAGAALARKSAQELLTAVPASPFQDLVGARAQALAGAALLDQAADAFRSEIPAEAALAQVKELAHQAFDEFEIGLEILNND